MAKTPSLVDRRLSASPFRGRLALARLPASVLAYCFEALLVWQDRARSRHHLQGLDDYRLKDLGLTRADVQQESSKPFWRA